MVGAEDGGVPGQVVEVVHDDGHEKVDHDEAAEEDEGDKVEVGGVTATGLVWVEKFPRGLVPAVALLIAGPAALAGQHDVRPGLPSGTSSKYQPWVQLQSTVTNIGDLHCTVHCSMV